MMNPARFALLIGILCISIFPVLIRLNLTTGLIAAFYRMAIAAVLLLPFAVLRKKLRIYPWKLMLLMAFCGILFGSDVAVWNLAIQESTATQATLLTNLAPVWVGIGSYLFLVNKPVRNFWIGTLLALIGMVVLVGVDVFVSMNFNRAFLLGLLSGVFYAVYILLSKKILAQVDVLSFMTYSLLSSSAYLGILAVRQGEVFFGFSKAAWTVLLVQGIVCQLLAWLLISYATQQMRATRVSLSLLSQAVIASLLAWAFLDEEISLQMALGGLIILFGIAITFYSTPLSLNLLRQKSEK